MTDDLIVEKFDNTINAITTLSHDVKEYTKSHLTFHNECDARHHETWKKHEEKTVEKWDEHGKEHGTILSRITALEVKVWLVGAVGSALFSTIAGIILKLFMK